MIENEIARQLIQERLQQEGADQQATPSNPAAEADTQQFSQAMQDTDATDATDAVQGVQAPQDAPPPTEIQGPDRVHASAEAEIGAAPTPGDNLLNSLDKMRSEHADKYQEIAQRFETGSEMSVSDLIKAQMDISQLTFEQDMAAKAAGKVSQGMDSLLKGQ